MKWAVTEKFSDYLKIKPFKVLTDNNPLTYILTSAKLDATGQRWASALGQYNFELTYRSGLQNADADGMSRYPFISEYRNGEKIVDINDNTVKAICSLIGPPFIETLPNFNIDIVEATEMPGQTMAQKELREVRRQQREDPLIE